MALRIYEGSMHAGVVDGEAEKLGPSTFRDFLVLGDESNKLPCPLSFYSII